MGAIKRNLIPDDYNCSHINNVNDCLECQYSIHTSHLPVAYTPSIETWYNRKPKKTIKRNNKKAIKEDCPF